jgi:hypothetical protein
MLLDSKSLAPCLDSLISVQAAIAQIRAECHGMRNGLRSIILVALIAQLNQQSCSSSNKWSTEGSTPRRCIRSLRIGCNHAFPGGRHPYQLWAVI